MGSRKFTGKKMLIKRLAAQIGGKGSKAKAVEILKSRGHLKIDGVSFTKAGEKRNNMTARQRAIDRASLKSGRPKKAYKYNSKTNSATLK
jgi:hypothetical protein